MVGFRFIVVVLFSSLFKNKFDFIAVLFCSVGCFELMKTVSNEHRMTNFFRMLFVFLANGSRKEYVFIHAISHAHFCLCE